MAKKKGKAKASKPSVSTKIDDVPSVDEREEMISAVISESNHPVLKICRLCETKDGPFLSIFDADKTTARKIKDLMPFVISENDSLPHKMCFRCSAKVEEFHEFVQKCVKAQDNLTKLYNKKEIPATKTKARQQWEEKLNESQMSNDDICDALIKMAMEGLKDVPLNPKDQKPLKAIVRSDVKEKYSDESSENDTDFEDIPLKKFKKSLDKNGIESNPSRASRSKAIEKLNNSGESPSISKSKPVPHGKVDNPAIDSTDNENQPKKQNVDISIANFSQDYDDTPTVKNIKSKKTELTKPKSPEKEKPKPFNIDDHVSMIKVNGVGVLFQCKLCNRNFLKKDIVATHGCAKNGVPKEDFTSNIPPAPEPPKPSVVKYINTKVIDDMKKSAAQNTIVKPKPRIGPASKVKREEEPQPHIGMVVTPMESVTDKTTVAPTVTFPALPNLKNAYKLVPGPNNTFTLVEEQSNNVVASVNKEVVPSTAKKTKDHSVVPDVINLEESPPNSAEPSPPYPVGLFQTLPHHSAAPVPSPSSFSTPAMRKQSYTVVQTGNPSKLLISTKPQPPPEVPAPVQKRRPRKSKLETKEDPSSQPFNVTLEDKTVPKPDYFTFVNLDPLLQPSYVLPTTNILQESQISTSTPPNPAKKSDSLHLYSCNMCSEQFTREKKLLAHIQSHYNQLDEEDKKRTDKNNRKKMRK